MAKDRFLGVATLSSQYKMHFPQDVADAMGLKIGDPVGFYRTSQGDVVVRRM